MKDHEFLREALSGYAPDYFMLPPLPEQKNPEVPLLSRLPIWQPPVCQAHEATPAQQWMQQNTQTEKN